MNTFFNNSSFNEQFHSANAQMNKTYKYTFHQHALKKFNLEDDSSLSTALKTQLLYAGMTNREGMAVEGFDPTTLNEREFTQLYATLEDYQVYCENEKYTLEATAFRTLLAIQMNKKLESMNEEMKKVYSYTLYDHAKKNFNFERDSLLSSTLKLQLVYAGMTNTDGTPNKEFDPSQLKKHEIIQLYTILADYQRSCEKDNHTDEAHAFGKLLKSIAAQIAESQDKHQAIDLMHHICKVQKAMAPHSSVTDEIQEIQKSKGFKEGIDALSAIEELQTINVLPQSNGKEKQIKEKSFNQWIENSFHSLTAESLISLDKSHSYQLAALLVATESLFSDSLKLEQAIKALPKETKEFYDHLKQLSEAGEDKIIELNKIYKGSKDKYLIIASTINAFKIPLKDVKAIEGIDLREFGPYLTYADFRGFKDAEAEVKLLQNYHNLYFLFINNNVIKSLPALPNLQVLDCFNCKQLTKLPSQLTNLQALYCSYCEQLENLPSVMPNLQKLDCSYCNKLEKLPDVLPNLKELYCSYCGQLRKLPAMPNLLQLFCFSCDELTDFPDELLSLQKLNCSYCNKLKKLPPMPNVQVLNCSNCYQLDELPDELLSLQELNCSYCNKLKKLPDVLRNLKELNCSCCNELTDFPDELLGLQKLDCSRCKKLKKLPPMPNLLQLVCSSCHQLDELPDELLSLQELNCSYCAELTDFPDELLGLQKLDCSCCIKLKKLPPMPNLLQLDCFGCDQLDELPDELLSLQKLNCCYSNKLKKLPPMPNVQVLNCSCCDELTYFPDELLSLQKLDCCYCKKLKKLPPMPNLLQLDCSCCRELTDFPDELLSLQKLDCSCCNMLERLPPLPNCTSLNYLRTQLRETPKVPTNCHVLNE